jgi:cell shape-determining protein MreC
MRITRDISVWIVAAAAGLGGLALWHAPAALAQHIHGFAYDVLQPGWRVRNALAQQVQLQRKAWSDANVRQLRAELKQMHATLAEQTQRVQQLAAQAAMRLETPCEFSNGSDSERLFVPALVEAAVLGETLSQAWREGRVLDRGWRHGVREAALVLEGRGPLIDLGASAHVSPEDPLLAGRAIVGKVAVVGRWTSTFLPVTAPEFRGRAQLVRDSERGPVWGATGLLRGDGDAHCRLEGVPAEEAVRVGDLVYSAERDGALPEPLAYGRVIDAHVSTDERTWLIVVEPATQPSCLTTVHVLRAALNPARFWAN